MNPYENIFQELVELAVKGELEKPKLAPRIRLERRLCDDGISRKIKIYPPNREYVQKFVSLIKFPANLNECWEWVGGFRVRNYGGMKFKGEIWLAHRLSLLFSGRDPREDGKCACHNCDNPICVNPAHLFIGTREDNMRDMANKGRANKPSGENNWRASIKSETVLNIRKDYTIGGMTYQQLANKYNTTYNVVYPIVRGISWKHV